MSIETLYQQGNDECATPDWIKEHMFNGWYDPCPLSQGLVKRDGLTTEWFGDKIFINPPYSKPMPWIERAITESQNGKTIALLLKNDCSTQWFAKLHEAGGHFLMVMGRLAFNNGKPAPFSSVIVILSPKQVKKGKTTLQEIIASQRKVNHE
jgi:hypothetical protein